MQLPLKDKILIILLLTCIISGYILGYKHDNLNKIDVPKIEEQIALKQKAAVNTLAKMKYIVTHYSVDSLQNRRFNDSDISYFFINNNNELIFWTDNSTDVNKLTIEQAWTWEYQESNNSLGIACYTNTNEGKIIAFIHIKNNFPFENNQLKNSFSEFLSLHKNFQISNSKEVKGYEIHGSSGEYLFTIPTSQIVIADSNYGLGAFILFNIAFILLLVLISRQNTWFKIKRISSVFYFYQLLTTSTFLFIVLYFNVPSYLFYHSISNSFDYAAGTLLGSIIHLTLITFFVLTQAYVFNKHTDFPLYQNKFRIFIILTICGSVFLLFSYILYSLITHSVTPFTILSLSNINIRTIWYHLILFSWGGTFLLVFYKTHNWAKKQLSVTFMAFYDIPVLLITGLLVALTTDWALRYVLFFVFIYAGLYANYFWYRKFNIYVRAVIWTAILSLFIIENALVLANKNKEIKYRILAENSFFSGINENDKITEIMFGELQEQLLSDQHLKSSTAKTTESIKLYLSENYLRGYWNKYDILVEVNNEDSVQHKQFANLLQTAIRIDNLNFYKLTPDISKMSYAGVFNINNGNNNIVTLQFYPRQNFRSYSFPKFLISNENEVQYTLGVTLARYKNGKLIQHNGLKDFPKSIHIKTTNNEDFELYEIEGQRFYAYSPDKSNTLLIREINPVEAQNYLIYSVYFFLIYLSIVFFVIYIYNSGRKRNRNYNNFARRYQLSFVLLLVGSFLGIFYVSFMYFNKSYNQKLKAELDQKKRFIQNSLQEKYYWTQDLSTASQQGLNFDLQELSYMYQIDINVYDNNGQLAGSSQPIIFNKNLLSRHIAPRPYFRGNSTLNQEENIGNFRFLNGYTDFLNGDYVQIGYISIPLFISNEVVKSEMEEFFSVVIHIYLIIVLLSILLSFIIGKQLSAPLILIQDKLRKMRLGQRNEKIDYHENNEIGQLVKQYNKTLDELEKSAIVLAQSEREAAWKTMARQIAHEINNPLTPMKLTIQQLRRTKDGNDGRFDDYFNRSTNMLIEQIDNLSRIAGSFSNFAKMPEARFEVFDIASKLYSTAELFKSGNEVTTVNYDGPTENIFVLADPEQMIQVFNNLLKNALQAIPGQQKGEIRISLSTTESAITIAVSDNGKGIDPELHTKVFVPSFTTKNTGMGLGLAISKNIIEQAGGEIWFESVPNIGTTFYIRLKKTGNTL